MLNATKISYGIGIATMVHGGVTSLSRWLVDDDPTEYSKWKGITNVHFYLAANYIKIVQKAGARVNGGLDNVKAMINDCFANSDENAVFNNALILGGLVVGGTATCSYFGREIATSAQRSWSRARKL